jgi:hypothetical protein
VRQRLAGAGPGAPRELRAGARAGLRGRAAEVAGHHQVDVLIADTSGRLHTNVNLMKELEKVCCRPARPRESSRWPLRAQTTRRGA